MTASVAGGADIEKARRMDGALLAVGVMADALKAKVGCWKVRGLGSGAKQVWELSEAWGRRGEMLSGVGV